VAVAALADACSEQREAHIRYRDREGTTSTRDVEPQRLVHAERRWYLLAWDKSRKDWRTFRVDRIELPITLGDLFATRSLPDDNLGAYVTKSLSGNFGVRARIALRAPIEELRSRVPHYVGLLEPLDAHSCRLHTSGPSLEVMAAWLGVLGVDFDVEDPPELVRHLHSLARRLGRVKGTDKSDSRRARP
jgi:predicted DNA-binding transcriptional regulator YafY